MKKNREESVISEKDNVATALKAHQADDTISVEAGGAVRKVGVLSEIPIGHKLAITDIGEGEPVIKYGESIGLRIPSLARREPWRGKESKSIIKIRGVWS